MLAGLLSLVLVAVAQFGFVLHVKNTATAHVIEGARFGARLGNSPQQGADRAEFLLQESLPGTESVELAATRTTIDGISIVQVDAHLTLPVLGPFGPAGALKVTGQAFAEDQ